MSKLIPFPIRLKGAHAFVAQYHRHHPPAPGGLFAVGLAVDHELIGVAVVGRPICRHRDNGFTAEVTRCCVREGNPHACSKLYAIAWRICRELGYQRIITYTLLEEPGTSLLACGWECIGISAGGSWNSPSRPRSTKAPTGPKKIWIKERKPVSGSNYLLKHQTELGSLS